MEFNNNLLDKERRVLGEAIDDHYSLIDISVQQRNNKKCWTVVSNLNFPDEKKKSFMQAAKKKLSCNGNIDENGNVRLNGNHKNELIEIICKELAITEEKIRIH